VVSAPLALAVVSPESLVVPGSAAAVPIATTPAPRKAPVTTTAYRV
jgi:hypothetical protein